jgi:predicted nucleic acid-binding protein
MGIKRLLDSVILIDHLNGLPQATKFLSESGPQGNAISVITRAEVLTGIPEGEEEIIVKALLDRFELLNIDKAIADKAAQLRRENRWRLPDAFQAALALYHGIELCTRNTRDFNPQKYPFVTIPYEL